MSNWLINEDVQASIEDVSHQSVCDDVESNYHDFPVFGADCFFNRELSWIKFNRRVVFEAGNQRTPLLERVKFLAIVSANIDEFYMKRIGGLKLQISAGVEKEAIDGRSPLMQLEQCRLMLLSLQKEKEHIYNSVIEELGKKEICISSYSMLNSREKESIQTYYKSNIWPLITPLVIDQSHPFPFVSNLSLNLYVTMKREDSEEILHARIKIPKEDDVPRFIRIGLGHRFIRVEDVLMHNIASIFPNTEIIACDVFRITRNAITENSESNAEDMLQNIARELRSRRFSQAVRLQTTPLMNPSIRGSLASQLSLDRDKDVFESSAMICMSDLTEIASLDIAELHDPPHRPMDNIKICSRESVFTAIREAGLILLQHPYESFVNSVGRFVEEASQDPKVAAIKMTLYRTSADTRILDYLINAARLGKHVAVVIELKARFDEEANMRWAQQLLKAGVHVSYGIVGLKTHCKTILVVRQEHDGLRSYAHISTGNYHAGTSRLYSDVGILTCDSELTDDIAELFNYLTTGCHPNRKYGCIIVAPLVIKNALLNKIRRETSNHSLESPGLIRFKTNALQDCDIISALYEASQMGVKVELIVRDICMLVPGVIGMSENINVVSIVGRFLEHSRIYYFRNGGEDEYYIGSADLMTRNLERRVELLVPIENKDSRNLLNETLLEQLADHYCAWELHSDGVYTQRRSTDPVASLNSQESAIKKAIDRNSDRTIQDDYKPKALVNQWLRLCF